MINKLNIISTNGGNLRLVIRINIVTVNYARFLIQHSFLDEFD